MATVINVPGLLTKVVMEAGKPVQARIEETVVRDGETVRRHGMLFIDRDGRTRYEYEREMEGRVRRLAEISDPIWNVGSVLDLDAGIVVHTMGASRDTHAGPTGEGSSDGGERLLPRDPSDEVYPLAATYRVIGTREIEGHPCRGTQFDNTDGGSGEIWLATDLGLPMLEVKRSAGVKTTRRLTDIRIIDPDPALFVVPPK